MAARGQPAGPNFGSVGSAIELYDTAVVVPLRSFPITANLLMNKKLLAAIAVLIIAGIVLFLVLRPKREHYTEQEVAHLRSLVAEIDRSYGQLEAPDSLMLRSFLAVAEHRGSPDSNLSAMAQIQESRRPLYVPIRQKLDSIQLMLRDSNSQFTKGLVLYGKATRQSVDQFEQQSAATAAFHDPNALTMPMPPAVALPPQAIPAPAYFPKEASPIAMPLLDNLRIIEQLKSERVKAKAMIDKGYSSF